MTPKKYALLLIVSGFAGAFVADRLHLPGVFSLFRSSKTEIAAPAFVPDPMVQQIIAAGNPYASPSPAEPWIKPELIDPAKGEAPGNVALRCKFQPVITKDGEIWRITFKP